MNADADVLQQLRQAWANLNAAQHTIARLGGYLRRTPGMKADLERARDQEAAARAVLNRMLAP